MCLHKNYLVGKTILFVFSKALTKYVRRVEICLRCPPKMIVFFSAVSCKKTSFLVGFSNKIWSFLLCQGFRYAFFAKWDNNHLDTHSQSKAWQHIYIKSFIYRLDLHNLFSFASLQRFGISWYSTEKFSLKKYLCFLGCTSTIWTVSIIYSVVAVEVQLF